MDISMDIKQYMEQVGQQARQAGADRQAAYYTMYRSTAHVIIGSGLTVAAAVFCLRFTRTPTRVERVDLLEEASAEGPLLRIEGGSVSLDVRPFEVATLRLVF